MRGRRCAARPCALRSIISTAADDRVLDLVAGLRRRRSRDRDAARPSTSARAGARRIDTARRDDLAGRLLRRVEHGGGEGACTLLAESCGHFGAGGAYAFAASGAGASCCAHRLLDAVVACCICMCVRSASMPGLRRQIQVGRTSATRSSIAGCFAMATGTSISEKPAEAACSSTRPYSCARSASCAGSQSSTDVDPAAPAHAHRAAEALGERVLLGLGSPRRDAGVQPGSASLVLEVDQLLVVGHAVGRGDLDHLGAEEAGDAALHLGALAEHDGVRHRARRGSAGAPLRGCVPGRS